MNYQQLHTTALRILDGLSDFAELALEFFFTPVEIPVVGAVEPFTLLIGGFFAFILLRLVIPTD